jgi:hypothetical protein
VHRYAFIADIEKAFLQILVNEKERDVVRFFWLNDCTKEPTADNIVIYRFCRVPFGIICSPFLLAATVNHHLLCCGSTVALDIKRNMYVDNLLSGCDSIEAVIAYYSEAKQLFAEKNMNLREWSTNCNELRDNLPCADQGSSEETTCLGLRWSPQSDKLRCSVKADRLTSVSTKRHVLKTMATLFDPCGIYAPVSISLRLLMQEIWIQGLTWDEVLPQELLHQWNRLSDSLYNIPQHCFPRRIVTDGTLASRYELHCFCDASAKAYAAVAFIREESPDGQVSSALVYCRSRVSPLKPTLTIPRLELMAVLAGVRMVKFLRQELDILPMSRTFIWSDSQCVLRWLKSDVDQTVFVRNRLKEIRSHSDIVYRYVPTAENPADLASRGCSLQVLQDCCMWWSGPSWLSMSPDKWPETPEWINSVGYASTISVVLLVHPKASSGTLACTIDLLDMSRYSTLTRLLRVVAWIRRFTDSCRNQNQPLGPLVADELVWARQFLDRAVQKSVFGSLRKDESTPRMKVLTLQLGLFVDDQGLIRCGGRIELAGLSMDATHPKLMPKNHYYSRLLMQDCHEKLHHAGVPHTLAELRQEYWVIQGRQQVKQVVSSCLLCRKIRALAFRVPSAPPLPDYRVHGSEVFENVGLDYLGPLIVKAPHSEIKVWMCLYTCALVRAIHIEVVTSLNAEQFLLSLRRFGALYGYPRRIISDNAKQFKTVKNVLTKVLMSNSVQDESAQRGITWKFITEKAPWMGGFYERLVALVKNALRRSLDHKKVSLVELQTLAYEISATLNSRPLVYVEENGFEKALCPADFLMKTNKRAPVSSDEESEYMPTDPSHVKENLLLTWKRARGILSSFWTIWQKQYLSSLRERSVLHNNRGAQDQSAQVGMTVIVQDAGPRGKWKMGRIQELFVGRDGRCRAATVMMPNGKKLNRPLKLLCPLEVCDDVTSVGNGVIGVADHDEDARLEPLDKARKSGRAAALRANQRIRDVIAAEEEFSDE